MRRFHFLLPFVVPVTLIFACDDSSSGGASSGVFGPDTGTFETGPGTDGDLGDTSTATDGAQVDGAMGTGVTVTVGGATTPQANVRVIFQDAAGAILGEAKTDTAGMAVSTALPSMVTVLYSPTGGGASVVTIMGVVDGDMLHVTPSPQFADTNLGDIAVSFAANGITAKAQFLDVGTSRDICRNSGSPAAPINIHMTPQCALPMNTIFGNAADASRTQGFGILKGIAAPSGGNTVNAGMLTVTASGTRTLVATNLPAGEDNGGQAMAISGTDLHFLPQGEDGSDINDTTGLDFAVPLDSIDALQSGAYTSYELAGAFSSTAITQREAATNAATGNFTSIDMSKALPYIKAAAATAAARPAVTITPSAAMATVAGYTRLSWGAENANTWVFVMPGNVTTFQAPALPADATAFTPSGPVTVDEVAYADGGALLPTYAALKLLAFPTATSPSLMDDTAPLPANGVVKLSTYEHTND